MSDSLWPHGLLRNRLPCLSPAPGAYSNSCPSSRWCHPTISPSVISFSSHLQSFPATGSFQISQFFTSGGQSIGPVLPMNIQDFSTSSSDEYSAVISFRIDWLDLLAFQDSQESFPTPQFKSINSSVLSFLHCPNSHPYMTTEKNILD